MGKIEADGLNNGNGTAADGHNWLFNVRNLMTMWGPSK